MTKPSKSPVEVLHQQIAAVCPIYGVSVGDPANKTTWRVDYAPEATQPQKDAAQGVINGFDWAAVEAQIAADDQAAAQRYSTFVADPTRKDVVTNLQSHTLLEIENYVRGKINADAAVDLATARACLKRIENAVAGLAQAVALVVRE